jgi:hypothetical protein
MNGGLNKFFNYMPVPKDLPEGLVRDFGALTEISWLMPLIGFAEVVGGLLIMLPKDKGFRRIGSFPCDGRCAAYASFCRQKRTSDCSGNLGDFALDHL